MTNERLASLVASGVTLISKDSTHIDDEVIIEAGCIIHPNVFLRGMTIVGANATVKQGCDIADSVIGEATVVQNFTMVSESRLGKECRIGPYAEVARSNLGDHCRIGQYSLARNCKMANGVKVVSHCFLSHVSIGAGAQLATGIVTSNYDGLMMHQTLIGDGAFIGSGAQLVAPVCIGDQAYVAAGSTITDDVPSGALAMGRARQVVKLDWVARRKSSPPTPVAGFKVNRSQYYRRKLDQFRTLVNTERPEEDYQKFLKTDYWILGSNYAECHSKIRAGATYVPDFVLERHDGLFEVVEIKNPSTPLLVRAHGRLVESNELKHAIAQLFDYLEYYKVHYHLSDGRAVMGIGRGLGAVEFNGFRVEMGESRRRFKEYSEAVLEALETGTIAYDGELYKQPPTPIRPRPLASFKGRTFASAVSPESMELMARMGVGLMVIAQKPWETAEAELATYRDRYRELNGHEAPKPILVVVAGVSKDPGAAQRMRDVYLQRWARSTVEHYQFDNEGFADIEGYEYYAGLAANINKHGLERFNGFLADLQVWGTPDQVTEKLLDYAKRTDAGGLVVPLCFGGMDTDEANEAFDVFAAEVLPELQRHDAGGDLGVTYEAAPTAAS